jgi:hypothetical protein
VKNVVAALPAALPGFRIIEPLKGANNSTQYNAVIGYASSLGGRTETIKIEVALREPLVLPTVEGDAKTILLDPVSGEPLVPGKNVRSISKIEAYAEKFRAALSRRDPAARDFFDLDYAVRMLGLKPDDAELVSLVAGKVLIPGNDLVDVSSGRLSVLRQQVETQLRPVLRTEDFRAFELDRAFGIVVCMANQLKGLRT